MMKLKNLLSDSIQGIIVVSNILGRCVFISTFCFNVGFDMKKFDFIKEIVKTSKEFVCGHHFDAMYRSLKLTYIINGDSAKHDMLRFVDDFHQDGYLDYFEWKELRRVVLESDFNH